MEKIKKQVIENCQREIDLAEYYIGYYKFQESKEGKEEAAKTALKRHQIEDALKINKNMLARLEEYNKTI